MSMCRVFSCVVGRGCLLWPVHFHGKTLLGFALLYSVLQGQICLLLQGFLDFLFLHSSLLLLCPSLLKCCWKRVFAMTSAFSCQNSISLCPTSFLIPRPNLPVTPGVSWLPTFAFQSPIMKRTSFGVLVLEGLVGLHRTIQLQLLQPCWSGHRLGLLWYWMVCLGNEQRSFCRFWDCIQVLHFRLFCWPWWLLHFFWGIPARRSRCNGHLS